MNSLEIAKNKDPFLCDAGEDYLKKHPNPKDAWEKCPYPAFLLWYFDTIKEFSLVQALSVLKTILKTPRLNYKKLTEIYTRRYGNEEGRSTTLSFRCLFVKPNGEPMKLPGLANRIRNWAREWSCTPPECQ